MSDLLENLTQVQLEILPIVQQEAWQHSRSFPTTKAQWNAYLNQVCLQAFLPWLQTEYMPDATVTSKTDLDSIWAVVNGTAIAVGAQKLVLIPSRTIDMSELRVPQEWVDIPDWVGNYYLAVQVNPDDSSVLVWGYTTHEQLKTVGSYDSSDRTYCLDAHHLIQDLSVLWVVHQLYPDEPTQVAVGPLDPIPATQAENLLQRLANPAIPHPRLELPFHLWGALLSDRTWRQRLYQIRQGDAIAERSPVRTVINLGQWLQNIFEESWQTIETLLGTSEDLAFSFRQTVDLSQAGIKRAKLLHLSDETVLLLVTLEPEADGRVGIRAQLRAGDRFACLPPALTLALLSPTGDVVQAVETRSQDNALQLKRFKCAPGTQFSLQITLESTALTEDFVV